MKRVVAAAALLLLGSCSGGAQKNAGNDAVIAVGVKANLAGVDVDSATAVDVAVSNGVVTLTGQARDARERIAYTNAARSVDGVTSVVDRLNVNPRLRGLREQTTDAALAARVAAAIAAQAGVNVFTIKTTAHDGVVTLDGSVPTPAIEKTVLDTARGVPGVRRVVAHLRLG